MEDWRKNLYFKYLIFEISNENSKGIYSEIVIISIDLV